MGCKGRSVLLDIPYINYWDTVLLPVGHTILLGISKDILRLIFNTGNDMDNEWNANYSITQGTKTIINKRHS